MKGISIQYIQLKQYNNISKTKDGTGQGMGTPQFLLFYPRLKQKKSWLQNNRSGRGKQTGRRAQQNEVSGELRGLWLQTKKYMERSDLGMTVDKRPKQDYTMEVG